LGSVLRYANRFTKTRPLKLARDQAMQRSSVGLLRRSVSPCCWVEQDPHHSVREILLTPPSAEGIPVLQVGGVQIALRQTIQRFPAVVIKAMVHREVD
jgi:hypothetical protein